MQIQPKNRVTTELKKSGVKTHTVFDILGFPYVFGITTANVSDRHGMIEMFSQPYYHSPRSEKILLDGAR